MFLTRRKINIIKSHLNHQKGNAKNMTSTINAKKSSNRKESTRYLNHKKIKSFPIRKSKFEVRCYECGRISHYANKCYTNKKLNEL